MVAIFFIVHGTRIRKGFRKHDSTDGVSLELFAQILVSRPEGQLFTALLQGIPVKWEETYDVVNPYGDRRGAAYERVWVFDLDRNLLLLTQCDPSYTVPFYSSVALGLALERPLTLDDFSPLGPAPAPPSPTSLDFPEPYWEPEPSHFQREKPFLARLLRDFGHAWRHLFRRQQNRSTFLRLAYAIIWITTLDFTIVERTEADRSPGGPYAWVTRLPEWTCPDVTLVKAGQLWFVLSETAADGLETVRRQPTREASSPTAAAGYEAIYVILTPRHVILVRRNKEGSLEWTKPEVLFDGKNTASSRSIDLLLLASGVEGDQRQTRMSLLPVEIQNHILRFTSCSTVAAAKLGCDLGLGSPFLWRDGKHILVQEYCKKTRLDTSPVESQVRFGSFMSGVSYKPQRRSPIHTVPTRPTKFPPA